MEGGEARGHFRLRLRRQIVLDGGTRGGPACCEGDPIAGLELNWTLVET
jgi:hypothetical protein